MRIIISDTSCLIDLRKADLLDAFINTPFERVIPDVIFEQELIEFTSAHYEILTHGVEVQSLPPEGVNRAIEVNRLNPVLTLNDSFAFALAESTENSILLTGDRNLRLFAKSNDLEVHGVLWMLEQIRISTDVEVKTLVDVLEIFHTDPTVHLPTNEITRMITKYKKIIDRKK